MVRLPCFNCEKDQDECVHCEYYMLEEDYYEYDEQEDFENEEEEFVEYHFEVDDSE